MATSALGFTAGAEYGYSEKIAPSEDEMPLPLAPLAGLALRYGAVALAAYAVARRMPRGRTDQRAEDALDDLPEGASAHRPADRPGQVNMQARFRRILRLGNTGPGIDIEASTFGRLRMRKV